MANKHLLPIYKMNKRINAISYVLLLIAIMGLGACKTKQTAANYETDSRGLKDFYKNYFSVGVAVGKRNLSGEEASLIKKHYNSITAENDMKMEMMQPVEGKFNWATADSIVNFGVKNNIGVRGHNLCWHEQAPSWFFTDKGGKDVSKEVLLQRLKTHIDTIVGRYKGKIYAWDVVNEALEEDGSLRKSLFFKLLGEDYIAEAFRLAAEADPNAELYYNDYNIEQPLKRAGAISLIKKLQAQGIRIDGVGIQGHWSIKGLPLEEIEKSIQEFSALGIKVMFTELDITVLPNPWDLTGADVNQRYEANSTMNPYPAGLPTEIQNKLAQEYGDLFQLFRRYQDKITRVTFWGVEDGHSWLNGWPIPGRTNYPLLFDRNLKPKPAYYTVIQP